MRGTKHTRQSAIDFLVEDFNTTFSGESEKTKRIFKQMLEELTYEELELLINEDGEVCKKNE